MSQSNDQIRDDLAQSIRQRLLSSNRQIISLCTYCEKRPDEFAILLSIFFWFVTSSVWQLLLTLVVTSLVAVFYFDVLRLKVKRWISQLPVVDAFFKLMVDLWTRHLPPGKPQIISASDLVVDKVSYTVASFKLAYERIQTRQNEVFLIIGGVLVALCAVLVWKYYILSLTMTIYWTVLFLLYWSRFQEYQVMDILCSIIRSYREQLESSFIERQKTKESRDHEMDEDDVMFALSGQMTHKAFDEVLEEELGYETRGVDQQPTAHVDDTRLLEMQERADSLYELDVDEMPSIAVGDDDSDDEWAFDADSASLAEEMHFTSGLEFPSLSQDSIDCYSAPRRRMHRQRRHPRSRLADLPENAFPPLGRPLSFVDEEVERERGRDVTSTPMEATAECVVTSPLYEEMHHLSTESVKSETHQVKRRQLPQVPQPRVQRGPSKPELTDIDSIYTSKGLRPQSNTTSHSEPTQPHRSTRMRSTISAPADVISSLLTPADDWNFQQNSLAVDKSLNDKLDLSEFDIPDQQEIEHARQSASESETPSRWLFG